jgi:hypothetical protein
MFGMSKPEIMAAKICNVLHTHRSPTTHLVFIQILPDMETSVKISTEPPYKIMVGNNRTDAVMFSSPITDVFQDKLPLLRGYLEVNVDELANILAKLVTAKPFFGITVYISGEGFSDILLGYL